MSDAQNKIIMLHETLWQSIVKDVLSAGSLIGAVGVGVWIESEALQWCAGIIWALWIIGKSMGYTKNNAFSFDEARKKIDQYEQEASK